MPPRPRTWGVIARAQLAATSLARRAAARQPDPSMARPVVNDGGSPPRTTRSGTWSRSCGGSRCSRATAVRTTRAAGGSAVGSSRTTPCAPRFTARGLRGVVGLGPVEGACAPTCTVRWVPIASTPSRSPCCLLAAAEAEHGFVDPRLTRLVPEAATRGGRIVVPIAAGASPAEQRRRDAAYGRTPSTALARLRSAPAGWQREHALERLLAGGPARGLSGYLPPFPEILDRGRPRSHVLAAGAGDPARADGWLPRELGPYRDRADLAARHAERARSGLVGRAHGVGAQQGDRHAAEPPAGVRRSSSAPSGGVAVNVEARVTSTQITDEPRSMMQLVQLRTQAHRTPGLLARRSGGGARLALRSQRRRPPRLLQRADRRRARRCCCACSSA